MEKKDEKMANENEEWTAVAVDVTDPAEAEEQEGSEDDDDSSFGMSHFLRPEFHLAGVWYTVDDVQKCNDINWETTFEQVDSRATYYCHLCKKTLKSGRLKSM